MVATVNRYRCDDCGCITKVDEDGCCVMCGAEARAVTILASDDPFKREAERREAQAEDAYDARREYNPDMGDGSKA